MTAGGALFPGANVMNRFGEALRRILDKFNDLKCYIDEALCIGSQQKGSPNPRSSIRVCELYGGVLKGGMVSWRS